MGGENWETRRGRSRAGLLRSPRDLHLDLATFGARQSLRKFVPLLALLGTALATLGRPRALLAGYVQALQETSDVSILGTKYALQVFASLHLYRRSQDLESGGAKKKLGFKTRTYGQPEISFVTPAVAVGPLIRVI